MGAAWETAAFTLRTLGARDQQAMIYAILGQILFLLSPLCKQGIHTLGRCFEFSFEFKSDMTLVRLGINAFAYMTVARMIYLGLPEKKIWGIKAVRLTTLFVWLDIVCFLVQLGGGGLLSNNGNANLISIGMKLYTAGIGIQLGFVVIFGSMTMWFYYRMHQLSGGVGGMGRMRYLIWALLAVLALIVVRCQLYFIMFDFLMEADFFFPSLFAPFQVRIVFRLIEFGPGLNSSNKYISNELYPLLLDAMPMTLALILLNVMHPGLVLKGPDGEFPRVSRKEKKALKRERKEEKRRRKEEKKQEIWEGSSPRWILGMTRRDWRLIIEGTVGVVVVVVREVKIAGS